jgi:hypothetical protein
MDVMDGSSLLSATFYDINEKNRVPRPKAPVPGVERSLPVLLQETGTWRMINASQGERQKQAGR